MDTEVFKQLSDILGINFDVTPIFIAAGVLITAFLKDKWTTITGWTIDLVVGLLMLGMNAMVYIPALNYGGLIFGTLFCYMGAVGGQAWLKNLAHKVGQPKNGGTQ